MSSEELTERALDLTTYALQRLNPLNYNLWIYRRKILRSFDSYDRRKELQFTEEIIRCNPKNFQAWEHRRAILSSGVNGSLSCSEGSALADIEMNLTESILVADPKNYSAWQHRQWTVKTFRFYNSGLFRGEFEFTDVLLCDDVRNNSAWHQRFFVLLQSGRIDFAVVRREIRYVIEKIEQINGNESAWSYLRGIIDVFPNARRVEEIEKFLIRLCDVEYHVNKNRTPQLVGFIIDMKIDWILEQPANESAETGRVLNMCQLMAEQFDTIRASYWMFVARKLLFDKIKCDMKSRHIKEPSDVNWRSKIFRRVDEC